jgi:hypothetical protein
MALREVPVIPAPVEYEVDSILRHMVFTMEAPKGPEIGAIDRWLQERSKPKSSAISNESLDSAI